MNAGFLLDTNIPSELMRPRPEPRVNDWVAAQDIRKLFFSMVTIGELETGFTTMPAAEHVRRARLEASLERYLDLLSEDSLLLVTRPIATRWGRLDGMRRLAGQSPERSGWNDCSYSPRAQPHSGDSQRKGFLGT